LRPASDQTQCPRGAGSLPESVSATFAHDRRRSGDHTSRDTRVDHRDEPVPLSILFAIVPHLPIA